MGWLTNLWLLSFPLEKRVYSSQYPWKSGKRTLKMCVMGKENDSCCFGTRLWGESKRRIQHELAEGANLGEPGLASLHSEVAYKIKPLSTTLNKFFYSETHTWRFLCFCSKPTCIQRFLICWYSCAYNEVERWFRGISIVMTENCPILAAQMWLLCSLRLGLKKPLRM